MEDYSKYLIYSSATITEDLIALNELSHVLVLFVINKNSQMVGTLTDGDIRMFLIKNREVQDKIEKVMTKQFHFVNSPIDLMTLKEYRRIYIIPCLDSEKKIIRLINLHSKKTFLPLMLLLWEQLL
jgi:predicted transcriptional regulator